jgi:hypothetical protein
MSPPALSTALLAVLGIVLGTILLVAAPASPSSAFVVGLGALVAAFGALAVAVRSVVGRSHRSAGVWLSGATIPVALLWVLFAFGQSLTSSLWAWKVALVLQVLCGGAYAVIALVAGAAAGAADREEQRRETTAELDARVEAAAKRVLAASGRSDQRMRIDAAVTRLLEMPRGAHTDPVAVDALGSDLERLALVLAREDEAEVEALVGEVERGSRRVNG